MSTTTTAPTASASPLHERAFEQLRKLLGSKPTEVVKRINGHIHAKTGALNVSIYHSSSINDEDKALTYKECLNAIINNDYTKLMEAPTPTKESGAAATTATAPEDKESTPTVKIVRGKRRVVNTAADAQPVVPAGDDSDEAALLAKLLKPKLDEPRVRSIVADVLSEYLFEADIESLGEEVNRLSAALEESGKLTHHDRIKDIARDTLYESLGNGGGEKVKEIVEDIIRTGAAIDKVVEASADKLMHAKVHEFIKLGAPAPSAVAVDEDEEKIPLASKVPAIDSTFKLSDEYKALFQDIHKRLKAGEVVNIMLTGPHGCGKSTLAEQFAAMFGMPFFKNDCANVREKRDWFGHKTAHNGTVKWKRSQFDRCLSQGNHVILLDELPRTTDEVRNTLFPLLDHHRSTFLDERGDYISVGKGTVIFATANEGHQYTGSSVLDEALRDRFSLRVEVDYLSVEEEAEVLVKRTGIDISEARKLSELGDTIRKKCVEFGSTLTKSVSTRQLQEAARIYRTLGADGLTYAISNHFSAEGGDNSERAQVLLMLQGKFPPTRKSKKAEKAAK